MDVCIGHSSTTANKYIKEQRVINPEKGQNEVVIAVWCSSNSFVNGLRDVHGTLKKIKLQCNWLNAIQFMSFWVLEHLDKC